MRKLFALLFVAAAFTVVSCDKPAETAGTGADTTAATADSVAVDPAPQAPVEDTTAAEADTTAPAAE